MFFEFCLAEISSLKPSIKSTLIIQKLSGVLAAKYKGKGREKKITEMDVKGHSHSRVSASPEAQV